MLLPNTPTPVEISATTPTRNPSTATSAMVNVQNQNCGTSVEITTEVICSVTLWNVTPGPKMERLVPGLGGRAALRCARSTFTKRLCRVPDWGFGFPPGKWCG